MSNNNKHESLWTRITSRFKKSDLELERLNSKPEDTTPTFRYFFKMLWRKKGKIFSVNMLLLLMIIPLFVCAYIYLQADKTPVMENVSFGPLYGIHTVQSSALNTSLLSLFSTQGSSLVFRSPAIIAIICILAVLMILWGWLNVGCVYVARGIVRHDPVFTISDFIYGIRKNWKQGFFLGLLDFIALFLLVYDFMSLSGNTNTFFEYFMFFTTFVIAILYVIMRFYLYLISITFDISIRKTLKNSFIFSILGIKRNLPAFFGILICYVVSALLIIWLLPLGIGVVLIIPFLFLPGLCLFMKTYAAYPVIEKYMIHPITESSQPSEK